MNENAKKWVEALRSGEYEQTTLRLRRTTNDDKHTYCCLGVACDVSGLGEWSSDTQEAGCDTYIIGDQRDSGGLPVSVCEWLGIDPENSLGQCKIPQRGLAYANDKHVSFDQIADIIESEPEGLFA